MCENKEDQLTDLTHWLGMMVGPGPEPMDQFFERLRQVILCLPLGTWCLTIRVAEPARFGLPSIQPQSGNTPRSGST